MPTPSPMPDAALAIASGTVVSLELGLHRVPHVSFATSLDTIAPVPAGRLDHHVVSACLPNLILPTVSFVPEENGNEMVTPHRHGASYLERLLWMTALERQRSA